ERFLPDKAIDLIDEAGSRIRLRHGQLPEEARELKKDFRQITKEKKEAVHGQDFKKDNMFGLKQEVRENIAFAKAWADNTSLYVELSGGAKSRNLHVVGLKGVDYFIYFRNKGTFWSLGGSIEFSVRSVRCLIDDVKSDTPTRWVKLIPIKANYTFSLQANYTYFVSIDLYVCLALAIYTLIIKANYAYFVLGDLYVCIAQAIYTLIIKASYTLISKAEHGLLIWPNIEENGVTRTKKYAELSAAEKIQADCDMKATNIILQGLVVLVFSPRDDPIACLNKAMTFLIAIAPPREAHINYLQYTQEQANILQGIVKQARPKQPLDNTLDFACSSKKAKILESNNANHSEPNNAWGSNDTDISSSSSVVMTGCPVRFGNDHIARIIGYGDYQLGNVTISRVYDVEGLGHNLFSIGQFCDKNLKVVFQKNTCFIRNLEGVDLLLGSRDTNLYTISLDDMLKTSPICLLSKASKIKSWLWHHRLSHLNFRTLNKLAKNGLARGIPRLKFQKDNLCSACALGKSKKSSHQPKAKDTNQEKLYLLHMDLCGPMRVASINGKRDAWDRLFQPIIDKYFNPPSIAFFPIQEAVAPRAVVLADSPVSTSIDPDAPSIRDHPIENVIGDPTRFVSTRKQLQTDTMWCYFDAFLTSLELKDFKQAMTKPSWIDAMQEEIHEFERLQVWEFVPCPDVRNYMI
nr:retrovirus-related Pol polyprotein from transposon TNT 1-94 [Tanacetum cinerariifolium]